MFNAQANVIITAKNQASKTIIDLFNETKRGLDQTTQAHKQAGSAAKEHGLNIVDLAAKLYLVQVGLRNVLGALKGVYEFGKLGATVEQTAISFERVITNAGQTVSMLNELRAASKGTASDIALMQMSNQALVGTTGEFKDAMAAALPKLLEMARASSILNPQLGNTEHQFDRLTLGLKRLEPRILDDIGLELRLTQVNREYADQIGKTAEELTVEQRSFALLNAVLAKHDDYLKLAGNNAENAVDAYSRLETAWTNLKNSAAEDANPALTNIVNFLTQYIEGANMLLTEITKGPTMVTDALKQSSDQLTISTLSQEEYEKSLKGLAEYVDLVVDSEGNLIKVTTDINGVNVQTIQDNYILTKQERDIVKEHQFHAFALEQQAAATEAAGAAAIAAAEAEKEWAEQKEKTLDDLFMKELESNEKLLDQRVKLAIKSIEIDTDYENERTDIHAQAEQDRIDIAERAGEEREDIARRYNDRIADIDKSIAELSAQYGDKNPFLSEATAQELKDVEDNAESLRDAIKRLRREQRLDPTDERAQLIADYEARLQEVEDHLAEIKKRAREEERVARLAFRIQELQDEKKALEKKRDQELEILNTQLQEKLGISIAKEEELSSALLAEYIKRRLAINNELNKIAEEADKKLKEATVDALLSLVPAGSTAAQALMELKWKLHGATDEMIQDFYRTKASIDGQDGLVGGVNKFAEAGFATFFGMQGVVAGLNGQLWYTKYLLDQLGVD